MNEMVSLVYFNFVGVFIRKTLLNHCQISCQLSDCKCRNTCSRKDGEKKKGCPCRTAGRYCSELCVCGNKDKPCVNKVGFHIQRAIAPILHILFCIKYLGNTYSYAYMYILYNAQLCISYYFVLHVYFVPFVLSFHSFVVTVYVC